MKLRAFWLPVSTSLLLSANAFSATTWTVTSTADTAGSCSSSCTLRAAINSAGDGDTIEFSGAIDGGTILLSSYSNAQTGTQFGPSAFFINANRSITIDGQTGLARGITIARDTTKAPFRLFDVNAGSGLSLIGLTLKNGLAQGFNSGSGGGALGAGGAIFNQGDLIIDSCTFVGNMAQGGASGDGSGNTGGAGVGSAPTGSSGGGPNAPTPGHIDGGFGGGGDSYSCAGAGGFGGGGGASPICSAGRGNGGFGGGGGKGIGGGVGTGGFGAGAGSASSGGGGAGMGGAIFNDAGALNIVNSTFTANSASGGAGGSGAAAGTGLGGAIFNYSAVLTISASTLARNVANDGGALYSFDDRNCAVGGNTCPNGSASTFDLELSIFSNSDATHDIVVDTGSPPAAGTFSDLIVMSRDTAQFTIANFASSADPQLSPLGNHGGWTPTMVPKQGSIAIDAVGCTSGMVHNDQRGVARPYPSSGQCDIGAVEYDGDYIFANGFD